MAISDQIPGLEITVRVDGKRAIEHDDDAAYDEPCDVDFDSPNGVRVVKYVEAVSGAPFCVRLERSRNFVFRGHHIGWSISVDGGPEWWLQEISARNPVRGAQWCSEAHGYYTGDSVSGFIPKRWKFGDLIIESADTRSTAEAMAMQSSRAKSLGVIKVSVHHLLLPNQITTRHAFYEDAETGPINEKALKGRALSLRTTADIVPNSARPDTYSYKKNFLDPRGRPFAVFEFRYRTREDLIKEAILRPPPDPAEDTPGKQTIILLDDDNDDAAGKAKEEAKVIKLEKKHVAGIKREAGEASQAPPSRRFKQTRRPDGKFLVDLTDD
ncbi:hypothetical protein MAPG_05318 [Magnaporthiopsis poae ATCC 64411]|uniref:DUF7918 domain-containing protein n=1 Tax=Magnaporthiopsis poae (strain ATCC 64411 / 73-15) TaxID=644358 RepID=A0A0C4DZ30_MAGP6|nr:hypothetical protein MAPG_05318 [Magnaporthiopsis poae ATCC 64411]